MSDAINDVERENRRDRLEKFNPEMAAKQLRQWRPDICNYEKVKSDLISLGYKVEESGFEVKIWKEI